MLFEALRTALLLFSVGLLFSSKLFELIRVVVIFVVVSLVGPEDAASLVRMVRWVRGKLLQHPSVAPHVMRTYPTAKTNNK